MSPVGLREFSLNRYLLELLPRHSLVISRPLFLRGRGASPRAGAFPVTLVPPVITPCAFGFALVPGS
jgi:hypothetical protein